ncbi:PA14 domain-containing protein [Chitinophaga sp. Hz27]|uniref:PA14 domain-containing protein n=1 Tax=Chitinophaga sp. Hz27 TaxID=3347169 RepID=UPI0035E38D90
MLLTFGEKKKKVIASVLLTAMYFQTVIPAYALAGSRHSLYNREIAPPAERISINKTSNITVANNAVASKVAAVKAPVVVEKDMDKVDGGPTQPEFSAYQPVGATNMVNLFTGDFNYNIPLIDVDGYPLSIGYSGGVGMADEASWVGLGWSVNPGVIQRNLRGLPDDFDGTENITKSVKIKENRTIGGGARASFKLFNIDMLKTSANLSLFKNNYKGWGMEVGVNVSVSSGEKGAGPLTGGLGLSNNSQEGLSANPSLSLRVGSITNGDNVYSGNVSVGSSFSTRSGLKAMQFSAGVGLMTKFGEIADRMKYSARNNDQRADLDKVKDSHEGVGATYSSSISYAYPSSIPSSGIPYTSFSYSGSFDLGGAAWGSFTSVGINGYVSKQYIADADTVRTFPAFGYFNLYGATQSELALQDYNREREIPIKSSIRNIGMPYYTPDLFSISGEGTGGMFRAYRNDVGYVNDAKMVTKSTSGSFGANVGVGGLFHIGADVNITNSFNEDKPWTDYNKLAANTKFTKSSGLYESVYLRNVGEMAKSDQAYFDKFGGTDVVVPELTGNNTKNIGTSGNLLRYVGGEVREKLPVTQASTMRTERAKRSQVITYLTADDASKAGFSKYIENYTINNYPVDACSDNADYDIETQQGLEADFWQYGNIDPNRYLGHYHLNNFVFPNMGKMVSNNFLPAKLNWREPDREHNETSWFSFRAKGRFMAPFTGVYQMHTDANDQARVAVNGVPWMNVDLDNRNSRKDTTINLEAGKYYDFDLFFYNTIGDGSLNFSMICDGKSIDMSQFSVIDTVIEYKISPALTLEKRINNFRKKNHLSEIDVMNPDGKKYVYGLPVYNLKQKEATFSVNKFRGNTNTGLVGYTPGLNDGVKNNAGMENYYSAEEIPAYAHTFLLTAILSPDYVDVTGNGVSDDDYGSAVKFNYSKIAGYNNPYKWRIPYADSANYNTGLRSDTTDDKGSYVYGEKELWYMNSIVSKNMVATFKLEDRSDLQPINIAGKKIANSGLPKLLREINLYTKAEFLKNRNNAVPVKTVHFEYSYELCPDAQGNGKLTLKRIWFSYNGNTSKSLDRARRNGYVFYYNKNNPGYSNQSTDRWGNYKNAKDNPNFSTTDPITNAEYPYSLQDSSVMAYNAGAWLLDSIKLPSGGRMKIDYESDDYAYVQHKRACTMTPIAGFAHSRPTKASDLNNHLYDRDGLSVVDNNYVAFKVAKPVRSKAEVLSTYLDGLKDTIFFRLNVKMRANRVGSGSEYVHCYGYMDRDDYGYIGDGSIIYIKLKNVQIDGDEGGKYSPLANAAIQFLKNSLPSKAYYKSDVGDDLDGANAIKLVASMATTLVDEIKGFPTTARQENQARDLDLARSSARLYNPFYKKYGGGHRVKRIMVYDNWNAMTGQKESVFGTEYSYTTDKVIDGKLTTISSGVASYEPILGGEDNPWHTPLTYKDHIGKLVPSVASYVETPLGESFFPTPSVGYSRVRTKSIVPANARSKSGYTENTFYTAYDFPTIATFSEIVGEQMDASYNTKIGNILKINAKKYMAKSQGFKIELNDMHGKEKGVYSYKEGDSIPFSSTEYRYKVDNDNAEQKHLSNRVLAIDNAGNIDSATIAMDMEIMMDNRQQRNVMNGVLANGAVEGFYIVSLVTSFGGMVFPQNEELMFRSSALTKVINRRGILEKVIATENGSTVTTKNMLYNAENGNVLLTSAQNEFNDSLYNFSYPAEWVYDGMGGAYKNINAKLEHINVTSGKLVTSLAPATAATYFTSGDELLVYSKLSVNTVGCTEALASFPSYNRVWVVDLNTVSGGTPDLYFVGDNGQPITGRDMTITVVRSGRKNLNAQIGAISMMKNPIEWVSGKPYLIINDTKKILNASMLEYKQNWQVQDRNQVKIKCALN